MGYNYGFPVEHPLEQDVLKQFNGKICVFQYIEKKLQGGRVVGAGTITFEDQIEIIVKKEVKETD